MFKVLLSLLVLVTLVSGQTPYIVSFTNDMAVYSLVNATSLVDGSSKTIAYLPGLRSWITSLQGAEQEEILVLSQIANATWFEWGTINVMTGEYQVSTYILNTYGVLNFIPNSFGYSSSLNMIVGLAASPKYNPRVLFWDLSKKTFSFIDSPSTLNPKYVLSAAFDPSTNSYYINGVSSVGFNIMINFNVATKSQASTQVLNTISYPFKYLFYGSGQLFGVNYTPSNVLNVYGLGVKGTGPFTAVNNFPYTPNTFNNYVCNNPSVVVFLTDSSILDDTQVSIVTLSNPTQATQFPLSTFELMDVLTAPLNLLVSF